MSNYPTDYTFEPYDDHDPLINLKLCELNEADPSEESLDAFDAYKQGLVIMREAFRYDFWTMSIDNPENTAYIKMISINASKRASLEELKDLYIQAIQEMPSDIFLSFLDKYIFQNNTSSRIKFTNPNVTLQYLGVNNEEMYNIYFTKISELYDEGLASVILNNSIRNLKTQVSLNAFVNDVYLRLWEQRNIAIHKDLEKGVSQLAAYGMMGNQEVIDTVIIALKMMLRDQFVIKQFEDISRDLDNAANKALASIQNIGLRGEAHSIPEIEQCEKILRRYLIFSKSERQRIIDEYMSQRKSKDKSDEQ